MYDIRKSGSKTLVILEINTAPGAMLHVRKINLRLGNSAEGFKVPLKALNDLCQLTVESRGKTKTIPVTIIAQNKKYAIVVPQNDNDTLSVNQKLVMP